VLLNKREDTPMMHSRTDLCHNKLNWRDCDTFMDQV